jgi:hypothetical protein
MDALIDALILVEPLHAVHFYILPDGFFVNDAIGLLHFSFDAAHPILYATLCGSRRAKIDGFALGGRHAYRDQGITH